MKKKGRHSGGMKAKEDEESGLSTYLLREPTKELIEELREDEAHVLERCKDKKGRIERVSGDMHKGRDLKDLKGYQQISL